VAKRTAKIQKQFYKTTDYASLLHSNLRGATVNIASPTGFFKHQIKNRANSC